MTWLDDIVDQHKELESPSSFWYWAALCAISASVKDNIWLDKFAYKLYPNIFVMLHANSGLKKGPPVSMAKQLVRAVNNTKIIAGRSSIQGILKELGTASTVPGGKVVTKSTAFICSSELGSSLVEDKAANIILTDLYDRNYNEGEWRSLLKMENFSLKDPTVTMLTATTEAHSEEFFMKRDIQGGYVARTFIIHESTANTINSLMYPLKNPPDYKKSAEYLREISKLSGEFKMDDSTRRYFDDWYHGFFQQRIEANDKTGTLGRFDDSILKVAMLLSLGSKPELVISKHAVEEATTECEKLVGNVRRTMMKKGESQWAKEKGLVIEELLNRDNHMISRQQLNKKYLMNANANEWDDIMASLEAGNIIRIENMGSNIMYVMPDIVVKEWERHLKGK